MVDHEKVFNEALKDKEFVNAMKETGEKIPYLSFDTLEKGLWAAAYNGWILGKYGASELEVREIHWKTL